MPWASSASVITGRMGAGIFFVGAIMATAFTTLILFQLFNVFNARSDEQSALRRLFRNHWLWGAIGFSLALQFAVIYVPFLQKAFSTVSLSLSDWLGCTAVASSVLWLRELSKIVTRATAGNISKTV